MANHDTFRARQRKCRRTAALRRDWEEVRKMACDLDDLMEKRGLKSMFVLSADNYTDDTVRPWLQVVIEHFVQRPGFFEESFRVGGMTAILSDLMSGCVYAQTHEDRAGENTVQSRQETADLMRTVQSMGMHHAINLRVMRCIATMPDFPNVPGFPYTQNQLRGAYDRIANGRDEETLVAELQQFHRENGDIHNLASAKGLPN